MSEHDIDQNDATMGENPGAAGDFGAGQGYEGQSADHAASIGDDPHGTGHARGTGHPRGTEQPRREEVVVDDDIDDAGEDEPIPGIDDATEPRLLTTPNDFDEGQALTGQLDDGLENNFDEGQAGGGVPGNRPGHGHGHDHDHGPEHRDGGVL